MATLAGLLRLKPAKLQAYTWDGAPPIPAELAVQIEKLVGREVVTREQFRPELYEIENPAESV